MWQKLKQSYVGSAGLPDPDSEKSKPKHLRNYRSEATELLARMALSAAHNIYSRTAPQRGKTNQNQPVLGFDGWGVLADATEYALVLVQVKGTDDNSVPPREARVLAKECKQVVKQKDKICRAVSIMAHNVRGTPLQAAFFAMLTTLGQDGLPRLVIAPAIIRGKSTASLKDLEPIKAVATSLSPAIGRGVTVSIGVSLDDFGRAVMNGARAA